MLISCNNKNKIDSGNLNDCNNIVDMQTKSSV